MDDGLIVTSFQRISGCVLAAAIASIFVVAGNANAADIRVLCSNNMKGVLGALAPGFETSTGHKLVVEFASAGNLQAKIAAGAAADVVVVQRSSIDALNRSGMIAAASMADVARSPMVAFVKTGTPKPEIGTAEAFKRRLLDAKSVTYPSAANRSVSGVFLEELIRKLGISQDLLKSTKLARNTAEAVEFVMSGAAELGMSQQSEIRNPQLVMSQFPEELGGNIVISAAVLAKASEPAAAAALVSYLSSPEAVATVKVHRLEPPQP